MLGHWYSACWVSHILEIQEEVSELWPGGMATMLAIKLLPSTVTAGSNHFIETVSSN